MPELPPDMKTRGRKPDNPLNDPNEELYRAFAPSAFDGDGIAIDAIELPDLSVNRQKYGPPGWLLLLEIVSLGVVSQRFLWAMFQMN